MKSLRTIIVFSILILISLSVLTGFLYFRTLRLKGTDIPLILPGIVGNVIPVVLKTSYNPGHVIFTDYTEQSGIDFLHHQAEEVIDSLPQVIGSGVCLLDYNNDGNLDVYLVNGSGYTYYYGDKPWWYKPPTNVLYHNNGNGRFTDITKRAGVGFTGWGMGCAVADYNNDGFQDIYVTYYGKNVLYENNGNGTFTNVTDKAGVGGKKDKWSTSAAWADYDNDGYLDLYVVNYLKFDKYMNPGEFNSAYQMPTNLLMNSKIYTGSANILFHNNKDGTFTDVTKKTGVEDSAGKGMGVIFSDFDSDGYQDIYVVNDGSRNVLFHNNGNGTFTDIGGEAGVDTPLSGMGVAVGDYDNDGDFDIFATYPASETNILYRNMRISSSPPPPASPRKGGEEFGRNLIVALPQGEGRLEEKSRGGGQAESQNSLPFKGRVRVGMGLFSDETHMNDSLTKGHENQRDKNVPPILVDRDRRGFPTPPERFSSGKNNTSLLFNDATVTSGLGEDVSIGFFGWGTDMFDYDNDGYLDIFVANGNPNPDFDNPRTTVGQRNQLFHNNGNSMFTDVSISAGEGLKIARSSRGAAFGDIDNDGDIDAVINNNNNYAQVLRNDGGNSKNYLTIRLKGTKSNRDGVGTKAVVLAGNLTLIQEVRAGSSYLSQNDTRLHFGLDKEQKADKIYIQWPSGMTQNIKDVQANQFIEITEGSDNYRIEKKRKTMATFIPSPLGGEGQGGGEQRTYSDDKTILLALTNSKPSEKIWAMRALSTVVNENTIDKAVEPVMMSLSNPDKYVRKEAADLLCKFLKDEQTIFRSSMYRKRLAVVPLLKALGDPEADVRASAVKALGYSESYRAIIPVTQVLKDVDIDVRREASLSLGWLKDKRGTEPLLEILRDNNEDSSVRSGALLSLIRLESAVTTGPLLELLQGKDEKGRLGALEVLKSALREDDTVLLNRKPLIQPLTDLIKDSNTNIRVRGSAIQTISLIKETSVVPLLINTLSDRSKELKIHTIKGLGELKDKRATNPLLALLKDKDEDVMQSTIISLADILDKAAIPQIYEIVKDKGNKKNIRLTAVSALKEIDQYYWNKNASAFLEDEIPDIRLEAVRGIAELHNLQSIDLLIRCLQNDNDRDVRKEVITALGSYKDKKALDSLIGIIKSSSEEKEIRSEAIISLTKIGDERAVIHLQGIAQNKRDELRAEAADAIERLGR
ncbi:MAG: VCBS repeat-containing protein [Nitrospirae bacterium]|nr:VCBS repeat-containing protein [Nitrospirota bacterium]